MKILGRILPFVMILFIAGGAEAAGQKAEPGSGPSVPGPASTSDTTMTGKANSAAPKSLKLARMSPQPLQDWIRMAWEPQLTRGSDAELHGAPAVLEDLVQALGQIVVDRASVAAFDLVKKRLMDALNCGDQATGCVEDIGSADAPSARSVPPFCESCSVLRAMRLEEISTSRTMLRNALASDLVRVVGHELNAKQCEFLLPCLELIVDTSLRPGRLPSADLAAQMGERIVNVTLSQFASGAAPALTVEKAVLLAAIAFRHAQADAATAGVDFNEISMLEVVRIVNQKISNPGGAYLDETTPGFVTAQRLAVDLQRAVSARGRYGKPDREARVAAAVDGLFVAAECLHPGSEKERRTLALVRAVVEAALAEDVHRLVNAASEAVPLLAKGAPAKANPGRGVNLLGAVLVYAQTYADTASASAERQKERTRILSSLVQERTAVGRGAVFGLGGSFRGTVGVSRPRLADPLTGQKDGVTFVEPSLTIGPALDVYGTCLGLHAEVGLLDLGRYVVNESSHATVEKPELADALSPSLFLGMFFPGLGRSYPVCLGAFWSYSPNYSYGATNPLKGGANNFGVSAGIYVPLFDFN